MISRFFRPPADATPAHQRQSEALNVLLAQIRGEPAISQTQWQGFAVVFQGDSDELGGRCRQVDVILYTPGQEPGYAHASRFGLGRHAEPLFMAMADGRPFDQVVVAVTYRDDTRQMETLIYWDEDASPRLINPDTWHAIADELNPFTA